MSITSTTPARHLFTVVEYHKMAEAGILRPDDRVELIEGEIVDMAPIGRGRASRVTRLDRFYQRRLGDRAIVWTQNPIWLTDLSEPQPDLALLRWRGDDYEVDLPGPQDVLLLVEVADTTFPFDRDTKLPVYARAGIPEVWIFELGGKRIHVFRDPEGDAWRTSLVVRDDGQISPLAFPDVALSAKDILG